ncbi:MAG: hypothetical protein KHY44_16985 [Clostridiales bacterium]|nr:hypothetical protein [Clostridiales bacterium]
MNIFRWRKIALFLLYFGLGFIASAFIFIYESKESVVMSQFFIGIGLMVVSAAISFICWRCPYCGKSFGVRHGRMESIAHCPFCGEKLR